MERVKFGLAVFIISVLAMVGIAVIVVGSIFLVQTATSWFGVVGGAVAILILIAGALAACAGYTADEEFITPKEKDVIE